MAASLGGPAAASAATPKHAVSAAGGSGSAASGANGAAPSPGGGAAPRSVAPSAAPASGVVGGALRTSKRCVAFGVAVLALALLHGYLSSRTIKRHGDWTRRAMRGLHAGELAERREAAQQAAPPAAPRASDAGAARPERPPDRATSHLPAGLLARAASQSGERLGIPDRSTIPRVALPPLPARSSPRERARVFIFTMDSLDSYVNGIKHNGAMGELVVRECLELALRDLGAEVSTFTSDAAADAALARADDFDVLVFDPWTVYLPGWKPRPAVLGREPLTFVLDFFGRSRAFEKLERIPLHHVLTATGVVPENEFLGFFYRDAYAAYGEAPIPQKAELGMVWGKDLKYLRAPAARHAVSRVLEHGAEAGLRVLASSVSLVRELRLTPDRVEPVRLAPPAEAQSEAAGGIASALASLMPAHPEETAPVVFGMQVVHSPPAKGEWQKLLRASRFLLGLGDPLLGPSAVEALAQGCLLIIPRFDAPKPYADGLLAHTQHDGVALVAPPEYVCLYSLTEEGVASELMDCVRRALSTALPPLRIPEFAREAHRERVRRILGAHLSRWAMAAAKGAVP